MKRFASIILSIGTMLVSPCLCLAFDYSGQWLGTVGDSRNLCENIGKAEPGDYKLTIIQKENNIVVMENVVQRPYTGVIDPERPQVVQVLGAYAEDGGYVNEIVTLEFDDDSKGKGQSVWRWSDGYYACGGRFSFTLTKIRP